jgi:S1-C subfamily serine protease
MVLSMALLAAVVVPSEPQSELKAVADKLFATVVQVRALVPAEGGRQALIFGSGVLVGSGYAVTTLHSVAQAHGIDVLISDHGALQASLVAGDRDLDLALLRLSGPVPLQAAPLAADAPALGESLVAMGAGEDEVAVVGVTVVAAQGRTFALATDHLIDSRFWGGPLFDARGRLAGIELTTVGEPRAAPATAVKALIGLTEGGHE